MKRMTNINYPDNPQMRIVPANHSSDEDILDAYSKTVISATGKVSPSVVQIISKQMENNKQNDAPQGGTGSGFLISSEGFIVTNSHV